MPFGLGFFATAGAGGAAGSFDLLESQILGSSTASVTFNSLSTYAATYQHLQIRMVVRNDNANDYSECWFRFNGDSGSNYSAHLLGGTGASAYSGNFGSTSLTYIPTEGVGVGNSASSGIFGVGVIDILDAFETTKNKTIRILGGRETGTGERRVTLTSGHWRNTNALTTILIDQMFGSNFLTGSRFSLYGWKAT
jgi:hypothetical protein